MEREWICRISEFHFVVNAQMQVKCFYPATRVLLVVCNVMAKAEVTKGSLYLYKEKLKRNERLVPLLKVI